MKTVYQPIITGHHGYLGANTPDDCRWKPAKPLKAGAYGEHRLVDEDGVPVFYDTAREASDAALACRWPTSAATFGARKIPLTQAMVEADFLRSLAAGQGGAPVPTPHRGYPG
jgi:hypothetical protein